ncbi:hypothetical protein [Vibrio cholerae]|uniref:hypothetical protein n=1 Tax=Vibrio cholerae TaxID=666 RepID=UPI0022F2E39A|nr:hypothetical protein [Vibrio cholerae]MDA5313208.1 hypothetical protein [Vibrio cholerae]MDA5318402.1 hypothetical protein [Vibrio cholerae]MDN6972347.1 hypothetical protein [Vibrio cholerae]
MKMSIASFALIFASASASASITTFATKNNTYPQPKPPTINEVPSEVKEQIINCPTIRDGLPIVINRRDATWVRVNIVVGKDFDTLKKFTGYYSDFILDNKKTFPGQAHSPGIVYDPKFNYLSNQDDFKPYMGGYSPYAQHTIYKNHVDSKFSESIFFVTESYNLGYTQNKRIDLPNRDFTVADILIFKDTYNLSPSNGDNHKWLYEPLTKEIYQPILARISLYRVGLNNIKFRYIVNSSYLEIRNEAGHLISNLPESIFTNAWNNGGWIMGEKLVDARKIKDLQVYVNGWYGNGKRAVLRVMANERGKKPLVYDNSDTGMPYYYDFNVTDEMISKENEYYNSNSCF